LISVSAWGITQKREYQMPIHNTHEVRRRRLAETWDEFQHSVVGDAINIIN